MSKNNLKSIPADIGRLKELSTINFSSNKLDKLPDEFENLWKLEHLDLSENFFVSIEVISRLSNLKHLTLRKNPVNNLENLESISARYLDVSECCKLLFKLNTYQLFMLFLMKFMMLQLSHI